MAMAPAQLTSVAVPAPPVPDVPQLNLPTYPQLVADLFPRLTGGVHWGLDRTRRLLASVGDPHLQYRVLHVGGTNGKGSVGAHLDSMLRAQGRRGGLYTSPHLCTFRERIRIDGTPIDERALLHAAHRLWPRILDEDASFFEATTAIAFLALADAGIDTAVVEVGLGGRLDSTNVVDPDVVVLTNVSLDHVQMLGPTLEHVATEKAGIIKRGVPVVTGETAEPAAGVFAATAARLGAPLRVVSAGDVTVDSVTLEGTAFRVRGTTPGELRLRTPLIGVHQAMNAALAVHALDCLGGAGSAAELQDGMTAVRWPGRMPVAQAHGVTWIFDVAHNVAGVAAMVAAVRSLDMPRPLTVIAGVLGDKDWAGMLGPIHDVADAVILTVPPTAPPDRRWDPDTALAAAPSDAARVVVDLTAALESAHTAARGTGGTVLVTGSFHTVGDAMAALGLCVDGSDVDVRTPALALPAPVDRV
ncbi:folylpolyglutamate synthase/dihydrofolate synthase family protein [soil metagenome]